MIEQINEQYYKKEKSNNKNKKLNTTVAGCNHYRDTRIAKKRYYGNYTYKSK